VILESLTILKGQGVLTDEYVQQQLEIVEEIGSGMNRLIQNVLPTRETEDEDHLGRMREYT
jgi:hypothetical protein